MPNTKSCVKRMKQNIVRAKRNQHFKAKLKTSVRKVTDNLEAGNVEAATSALPSTISVIASVAAKGIIPQKRASRKISRLTKAVNAANA